MTPDPFWSEVFQMATGLGLGGVMLAAATWYFKGQTEKTQLRLETEQTARLLVIEKENAAKLLLLEKQNEWCMGDRTALHRRCDEQQKMIDSLNDKIIDIYKSRHSRMVVESLHRMEDPATVLQKTETGKVPKLP